MYFKNTKAVESWKRWLSAPAADIGREKANWCHALCLGTGFKCRARKLPAPTTKESCNGNGNTMKTN